MFELQAAEQREDDDSNIRYVCPHDPRSLEAASVEVQVHKDHVRLKVLCQRQYIGSFRSLTNDDQVALLLDEVRKEMTIIVFGFGDQDFQRHPCLLALYAWSFRPFLMRWVLRKVTCRLGPPSESDS